jgi:hypothetical protein
VHWSLLDTTCVSSAKSHAPSIRWNERKLLLAGNRIIDPAALARRLRVDGLRLEVHDRDPLPPPPPPPPPPTEGEPPPHEEEEKEAEADTNEVTPQSVQHPPFGVGRASLGDLIPRRRTDTTDYRLSGLPIHPPRRLTLELDILPCELTLEIAL